MKKTKMTKEALLEKLEALNESYDVERAHGEADDALIEYINDAEIAQAYESIKKWYA